jgi:hypothetical protein
LSPPPSISGWEEVDMTPEEKGKVNFEKNKKKLSTKIGKGLKKAFSLLGEILENLD